MASEYRIEVTATGFNSIDAIRDKKERREILSAIDALARQPEAQGKPLTGPLSGLRSLKVFRNRYRIIFKVNSAQRVVTVLLAGKRMPGHDEDIYSVAQKLLDLLME